MSAPFVRPDVKMILDMLAQADGPKTSDGTPEEGRAGYLAARFMLDAEPSELAVIKDLSFDGPAGPVPVRYYDARETREAGPAIVFFHGGGFVIGDLETHHPFCTYLAEQMDLPVIAVDYRLAPEHKFPAAALDSIAAARWVASSPAELGLDVTGIITTGDSAGGNLTIVTTQALMREAADVPVIAQMPIYPVVDSAGEYGSMTEFSDGYFLTEETMTWFTNHYAVETGNVLHDCLNVDHAGTPPTVLITGGLDPLRDQGRAYAARLIEAGCEVNYLEAKGNTHAFIQMRKVVPSSQADVDALFAALKLAISP